MVRIFKFSSNWLRLYDKRPGRSFRKEDYGEYPIGDTQWAFNGQVMLPELSSY